MCMCVCACVCAFVCSCVNASLPADSSSQGLFSSPVVSLCYPAPCVGHTDEAVCWSSGPPVLDGPALPASVHVLWALRHSGRPASGRE